MPYSTAYSRARNRNLSAENYLQIADLGKGMAREPSQDSRVGERPRRAVLIRCGTLAGATVATMAAWAPAMRAEATLPLLSVALLGTLLVNLMAFERTQAYRPAVAVVLGSSSLFFLGIVHYTDAQPSSLVWAYLFQTLPYVLAGQRIGAAVVVAIDAALVTIIWLADRSAGASPMTANETFFTGFIASLLVLAGVSWLFEHVRKKAHDRLVIEVAERRRAEGEAHRASRVAKQSAQAQARFLANMSHEIRTPMNGVLGVNELLLLTSLSGEQRDYARTINESAKSLLTVLNDILDLSKIESGHVTLEQRTFDLCGLVNSLVALFRPEAKKKGLELSMSLDGAVPAWVEGDDQRLRQVLSNLLRNAIKFTEKGRVDLVVVHHGAGDRIRFEVRDTGIGLTAEQKTKIFDAFQQADSSTTRRYGGTGLGLSISRQLVQLMGGQLSADGRRGRGSVFWFVIPLVPKTAVVSAPSAATPPPVCEGVDRRVLVVEDNPVNRKVVGRMLERLHLDVETAEDGEVALQKWTMGRYLMVFMDVQMPRRDGFDTTRAIRGREAGGPLRTPIIALTANAMQGDREKCLAAGMDDYLSKPVVFGELKRTVQKWSVSDGATGDVEAPQVSSSSASPSVPASTTAS